MAYNVRVECSCTTHSGVSLLFTTHCVQGRSNIIENSRINNCLFLEFCFFWEVVFLEVVERILALMKERDVKASHLTKKLSLSHGVVTQWKQGLQKPSTEAVIKIARHFGVTTDWLLN